MSPLYTLIDNQPDFLVVDKKSGASIHNESGQGLIQQLRRDFVSEHIVPVHRLDKGTSGLLVCAKNTEANRALSQLFRERQIEKYYLAISDKKPSKKQGWIIGDMVRTRNGSWKLTKDRSNPAITQFFSYGLGEGKRLFVLKPHTGKTHQLRVALKSISAPILGDQRYGYKDQEITLHLHAYSLRFPLLGCSHCYQSPPSGEGFSQGVLDYIEQHLVEPWALNWPSIKKV